MIEARLENTKTLPYEVKQRGMWPTQQGEPFRLPPVHDYTISDPFADEDTQFTINTQRGTVGKNATGAQSFQSERHTPATFVRYVLAEGASYTSQYFQRWPNTIKGYSGDSTTPRIKENFISNQLLTQDDDRQMIGVIDFWLRDPFFSQYGLCFVESNSSQPQKEKGHPIWLMDEAVTDGDLFEEIERAIIHKYNSIYTRPGKPPCDITIKTRERLFYNKPGAAVKWVGNTLPMSVIETELLTPYRAHIAEIEAAAAAKAKARQERLTELRLNGRLDESASSIKQWIAQEVPARIDTYRDTTAGRNPALYTLGRFIGSIAQADWCPEDYEPEDYEPAIMAASVTNGYIPEYADENEVLRILHAGIKKGGAIDLPVIETNTASKYILYPGEHSLTIELREGEYLSDKEINLPQYAFLKANTGTAKTTTMLQLEGKVILIVPTQMQVLQIAKKYKALPFMHGFSRWDEDARLVVTTPDSLPKVRQHITPSEWILAIDEAHEIAVAGYRRKAWGNVANSLGDSWKQIVLLTGTPFPLVGRDMSQFQSIAVKSPAREQKATLVHWQDEEGSGDKYATWGSLLPSCNSGKRVLTYLQSKRGGIAKCVFLAQQQGYTIEQIAVLNTDTRGGGGKNQTAYLSIAEDEIIPAGVKLIIATGIMTTGINILTDIDQVHLLSPMASIEAQQLVNRFRTAAPGMVYDYVEPTAVGELTRFDVNWLSGEIAKAATTKAHELNLLKSAASDTPEEQALFDMKMKHMSQYAQSRLVERVNELDEDGYHYVPSLAGIANETFEVWKSKERENPRLLKLNLSCFGWSFEDDMTRIVAGDEGAKSFAKEQELIHLTELKTMADNWRELGYEAVTSATGYRSAFAMRNVMWAEELMTSELVKDWETAVNATLYGRDDSKFRNTIKRMLTVQAHRHSDPFLIALYQRITPGGDELARLTAKKHDIALLRIERDEAVKLYKKQHPDASHADVMAYSKTQTAMINELAKETVGTDEEIARAREKQNGACYSSEELQSIATAVYLSDPIGRVILAKRWGDDPQITQNRAVRLFRDLFHMTRRKRENEAGEKENVWYIVSDVPMVPGYVPQMKGYETLKLAAVPVISFSSGKDIRIKVRLGVDAPPAPVPDTIKPDDICPLGVDFTQWYAEKLKQTGYALA